MAFVVAAVSPMVLAVGEDDAAHRAVGGTMKTVGEAAIGTTKTAVSPIVAFWRAITGQGKPEKIITDPVQKGGETVYEASVGTGKTVAGQDQDLAGPDESSK